MSRLVAAGAAALASLVLAAPAGAADMRFLANDKVRVGVDLQQGGAITHVSTPNGPNVVNHWDLGRQVQQSYYAGPEDFGNTQKPEYDPWPWNPVAAGDTYRNPSTVLVAPDPRTGTLYTKTRPKQWALSNVDCECIFEQWVTLAGNAVRVRTRLTNARSDTKQYPAKDQELPAVYVNRPYSRFFTYAGDRPFTNAPVEERKPEWPAKQYQATERWAAWVDASGFGLGVVSPDVQRFGWGFFGTPGAGDSTAPETGYISPVAAEILDHDIVYDGSYDLVLGTVAEIRGVALRRASDPRPDYRFERDRQHFTLRNATDTGWPITGALRVKLDGKDPHIVSPERRYPAAGAPKLYIRAAFRSKAQRSTAELFWRSPGGDFTQQRSTRVPVIADGTMRTYVVDLAGKPGYTGSVEQLRFDPLPGNEPGASAEIASIGWKPPQAGGPGGPGADRTKPRLTVSTRGRQKAGRRGIRMRLRCNEACSVTATASGRAGKRRLTSRLRTVKLKANRWRTVRVRPSKKVYRRTRSALRTRRQVKLRVTVRARDTAGNRATKRRTVKLRR